MSMSEQPTQKEGAVPQPILPGLYLVATPIGNLRDITLRALDVLQSVDQIYCEDKRVSSKLLNTYDIRKPLFVYNDHSDEKVREKIVAAVQGGEAVALVSDAGMPLVSDPGYKLVRTCYDAGVKVTTLPGANAVLSGLQLSGLPSDRFMFHGFLPAKEQARQKELRQIKDIGSTHVFYESANRLEKTLRDVLSVLGDRDVAIVREITKMFEEVKRGSVQQILVGFETPKGEVVLVVGGPVAADYGQDDVDSLLVSAMENLGVKEAAAAVADKTGLSKKILYDRALELKS